MNNHIEKANLNIFNGVLQGTMEFLPGLNLISGENGTLKTRLLQTLKSGGGVVPKNPHQALQIQAISPKRNSERRAADSIIQTFRQQNRTYDAVINERLGAQINDANFENYPSLSDLYYLVFEQRTRDGDDRRKHMSTITDEFNSVIHAIFENYDLIATWNEATGAPSIRIQKGKAAQFPIESLSLGEQEILSLAANIYSAKERTDVFLIDEPEVHLNWHLEHRLFQFLDTLCETYSKQAIIVTHSRAIFKQNFLSRTQFLYWNDEGQVQWAKTLRENQYKRIAGEAIEIIRMGDFSKPTFFVEDQAHVRYLELIGEVLGVSLTITECGNSPNVKSLFRRSRSEGGWQNTYFMVDGDNEGNPFQGEPTFIHVPMYCTENFFLNPELLTKVFGKDISEILNLILDVIKNRRNVILQKNKFFEFLIDGMKPEDLTYERLNKLDASEIMPQLSEKLGTNLNDLTSMVVKYAHEANQLEKIIPPNLLAIFQDFPDLQAENEATS